MPVAITKNLSLSLILGAIVLNGHLLQKAPALATFLVLVEIAPQQAAKT